MYIHGVAVHSVPFCSVSDSLQKAAADLLILSDHDKYQMLIVKSACIYWRSTAKLMQLYSRYTDEHLSRINKDK